MASKLTQVEGDYGRGDPISHCGICVNYLGRGQCKAVMGKVSPYGLSNQYKYANNPFGKTLSPQEVQAIKAMAADASNRAGG